VDLTAFLTGRLRAGHAAHLRFESIHNRVEGFGDEIAAGLPGCGRATDSIEAEIRCLRLSRVSTLDPYNERPRPRRPEMLWHAINDAQRLSPRGVAGMPAFGRPVEPCGDTYSLKPGRWRE